MASKRILSPEIGNERKKAKLSSERDNDDIYTLLRFSDDVLILIFAKLTDCKDLLSLTETCTRLSKIASDKSLWTHVCSSLPIPVKEMRKILKLIHSKTTSISIKGFLKCEVNRTRESITPSILQNICDKCPDLEKLEILECFIDGARIQLEHFPKNLKSLSIKDSEVVNIQDQGAFFTNVHTMIPNLTKIDLRHSGWLSNHAILSICKCVDLLDLNLQGCFRIGECFAYTALACRFGFRKLQRIDLRDTEIGNSEVTCFGRLPNLIEFYLGFTSREMAERHQSERISDKALTTIMNHGNGDAHISKIEVLSVTYLSMSSIKMFQLVKNFKQLKKIDVRGTNVTDTGVRKIKSLNPDCIVVFDPDLCQITEEEDDVNVNQDEEAVYFFAAPV